MKHLYFTSQKLFICFMFFSIIFNLELGIIFDFSANVVALEYRKEYVLS